MKKEKWEIEFDRRFKKRLDKNLEKDIKEFVKQMRIGILGQMIELLKSFKEVAYEGLSK